MSTATAVRDFRIAQNKVVALAQREIRSFWASVDKSNAVKAARLLEAFMPELIQDYGEIGAAVAAEFYTELREASPTARKAYNTILGDAVPFEQTAASSRWAAGPMFGGTGEAAVLSNLIDLSDRLIKQQARNTITQNSLLDPQEVRYARVPSGAETCDFCLMLASRGAVYASSKSAGELNRYHGLCDCTPVAVWSNDDYDRLKQENDYDPDALYQVYLDKR